MWDHNTEMDSSTAQLLYQTHFIYLTSKRMSCVKDDTVDKALKIKTLIISILSKTKFLRVIPGFKVDI